MTSTPARRLAPGETSHSAHHVAHIYINPEGDREVDLFHPGRCGFDSDCPIEEMVDTIGLSETFEDFDLGTHRIAFWIRGGGWITGDYAIDCDMGIEEVGSPEAWWESGRPDPASRESYQ